MPWTVEYHNNCTRNGITPAEYTKLTEYLNYVRMGTHPRAASEAMGHMGYEKLQGNTYSVRLSQGGRLYFEVDDANEVMTLVQVGGHR